MYSPCHTSLTCLISFLFDLDQLGAIPTYSLPSGHLCSSDLCRESLSWTIERCWNHQCMLWASQSDGEMWPTARQIHGLLSFIPWWCGAQGCECSHCNNQDEENHSVCRLVSHWIQGEKMTLKEWRGLFQLKLWVYNSYFFLVWNFDVQYLKKRSVPCIWEQKQHFPPFFVSFLSLSGLERNTINVIRSYDTMLKKYAFDSPLVKLWLSARITKSFSS